MGLTNPYHKWAHREVKQFAHIHIGIKRQGWDPNSDSPDSRNQATVSTLWALLGRVNEQRLCQQLRSWIQNTLPSTPTLLI